eukprot:TRINITY_DN4664_c0_g1_i1.p1 TRINITY_DN4664_c0_g1~~TRINITY_DN4664_c0_g1_i1.p1  ORF type:complete len:162 (+),score=32.32 TRINITY_DN4664_c0_g1_i1:74-559(+)
MNGGVQSLFHDYGLWPIVVAFVVYVVVKRVFGHVQEIAATPAVQTHASLQNPEEIKQRVMQAREKQQEILKKRAEEALQERKEKERILREKKLEEAENQVDPVMGRPHYLTDRPTRSTSNSNPPKPSRPTSSWASEYNPLGDSSYSSGVRFNPAGRNKRGG